MVKLNAEGKVKFTIDGARPNRDELAEALERATALLREQKRARDMTKVPAAPYTTWYPAYKASIEAIDTFLSELESQG